jgi:hypothetical protein
MTVIKLTVRLFVGNELDFITIHLGCIREIVPLFESTPW